MVNDQHRKEIEKLYQFCNLGSVTDVQGGADADVKSRIGKARQALFYIIEANMDFKKDLS